MRTSHSGVKKMPITIITIAVVFLFLGFLSIKRYYSQQIKRLQIDLIQIADIAKSLESIVAEAIKDREISKEEYEAIRNRSIDLFEKIDKLRLLS